jgi:uncharacterized Zn-binding protein involved in type VI secretion
MGVIGWIRMGDKASCSGVVAEGDQFCRSYSKPYAFQGARMACRKNCIIADGVIRSTLTNGRAQVTHGMKTSNGCPLVSTLNDIDGVGDDEITEVPCAFAPDGAGGWKGVTPPPAEHDNAYDEYFILLDESSGIAATNRSYRITFDSNESIEGFTDDQGRTKYATSDKRRLVSIEISPPFTIQSD